MVHAFSVLLRASAKTLVELCWADVSSRSMSRLDTILYIASALTDSPAGLAAWILDKQVTQTRPYENIYKDDGGLKEAFDRDQLLTNIMIFWWSNSIGSSVRLYKECCGYFGCDSVEESRFRCVQYLLLMVKNGDFCWLQLKTSLLRRKTSSPQYFLFLVPVMSRSES